MAHSCSSASPIRTRATSRTLTACLSQYTKTCYKDQQPAGTKTNRSMHMTQKARLQRMQLQHVLTIAPWVRVITVRRILLRVCVVVSLMLIYINNTCDIPAMKFIILGLFNNRGKQDSQCHLSWKARMLVSYPHLICNFNCWFPEPGFDNADFFLYSIKETIIR